MSSIQPIPSQQRPAQTRSLFSASSTKPFLQQAMIASKFAAIRSRSGSTSSSTRASTPRRAQETTLIGVRYEKTVQAEPPTPMPPRNRTPVVSRAQSIRSTAQSSTRSLVPSSSTSSFSRSSTSLPLHNPIVVAPPSLAPIITITVAPPAEQHPALRAPSQQSRAAQDCWKRDSGHAPTTAPSATIHEEDENEDDCHQDCSNNDNSNSNNRKKRLSATWTVAIDELIKIGAMPLSVTQHSSPRGILKDKGQGLGDFNQKGGLRLGNEPTCSKHVETAMAPISASAWPSSMTGFTTLARARSFNAGRPSSQQRQTQPLLPSSPSSPTWCAGRPPTYLLRHLGKRTPSSGSDCGADAGDAGDAGAGAAAGAGLSAKGKLSGLASEGSKGKQSAAGIAPVKFSERLPLVPPAHTKAQQPPQSPSTISTISLPPWSGASASTSKLHVQDASPPPGDSRFRPLGLRISTSDLVDDGFMASLSFSERGSIMLGSQHLADLSLDGAAAKVDVDLTTPIPEHDQSTATDKAAATATEPVTTTDKAGDDNDNNDDDATPNANTAAAASPSSSSSSGGGGQRIVSPPSRARYLRSDPEKESQKVRSLYGVGDALYHEGSPSNSGPLSPALEVSSEYEEDDSIHHKSLAPGNIIPKSSSFSAYHNDAAKSHSELAGGLEDWKDVDGADVDRYGFIVMPRMSSPALSPADNGSSASPRRRNLLQKKDLVGQGSRRPPSRKISARSLNTVKSGMSATSMRSSRSVIRQAGNLLPHNRDRRWMDEAGEMLTLPPGLQGAAEEAEIARISESLKHKEWERSEKWRKMAKVVRKGGQGEGMEFEFDIKNPKLIERTWKGIPDRWRATAWWSFLAAAAKEHGGLPTEAEIANSFHQLLEQPSPDDVQIDLDVPRTISRHIMFRRRYRGGQRLLFRVLHALSLYFPETGYVQGMASLAATLLCYFEEERCFVMLVRMWQLRGLDRLYKPGFEGLMTALKEFSDSWLNKDVAKKLSDLSVDITAYGTRWYLTLFNLSIPFPAQLRVWDVFLLLGDNGPAPTKGSGLNVLHATSAALIQALGELLLDSDFENAMKALTSWIPIKDEDLLMKVSKAEWKSHQGKKRI